MAVSGLGRTETCIVHHDRAAAARCGRCHKPICQECVISTADGKFCSRECAAKTADFRAAQGKMKKTSGAVGAFIKKIVLLVIVLFVLGGINKYYFKGKMPVIGGLLNKLPIVGGEPAPQAPASPEAAPEPTPPPAGA